MNRKKEEKKQPFYYFIIGIVSVLSGIANIRYLITPENVYEVIIGVVGVAAIIGSVILFKEYKRLK